MSKSSRSMADRYRNFAQLRKGETEGIDYRICITERASFAAIIAPHGGRIEPGTSEIAAAIAENAHSLYCFEGLGNRPHRDLHITSTNFDEPQCLDLIARYRVVIAVHGLIGDRKRVDVGGRDLILANAICTGLKSVGFTSRIVSSGSHAAILPNNICNKGQTGSGVQLEITKCLRDALLNGEEDLGTLAHIVRQAIGSHQPERL